jgi:hypothetical protein
MNSKMTFAATSLLLAGVLAVSYGCASSTDESGDTGGTTGSSSSTSAGGGGGGSSSSSSGGGGGGATPSGDNVVFKTGKADGLFSGYGWVALGKDDSLTSPGCDTKEPITASKSCTTSTVWSKEDALCMSGAIPALPASPAQADYDNNWGVQIGVNAKEPSDAIGDSIKGYVSVSFVLSGSPSSGLRAMFHRKGDPDGTTYCADSIKSDTPIKFTKFNTKCWGDPASVFLTEADLPMIDKAGVQVSSTSAAIEVKDLCLSEIKFQK